MMICFNQSLTSCYRKNEECTCEERIRNVEHGTFTPSVAAGRVGQYNDIIVAIMIKTRDNNIIEAIYNFVIYRVHIL